MSMTISEIIVRVAIFNSEIAQLREAITTAADAEPSHSRRGPLLTARQLLIDVHNGIQLAQARYQSARQAA
jgi:hypothetical protein